MDKGCAWIIGIAIVIGLFANFPKFMFGLLGVGFVIFVIYEIFEYFKNKKYAKELKELELKKDENEKRQQYASEYKRKSSEVVSKCYSNAGNASRVILQPNYKGVSLQGELWNALNDASVPLQKLEDIVAEISTAKEER
ncbi:MAG: hypothetical protein LBH25_13030 [Fibromonadaceae bacterium]|nr:hypothetical protein [Fibromonadaceae bacterium]